MGIEHQNAAVAVGEAAEQARTIVDALAAQDHPQTTEASGVFQSLVRLEGELFAVPQTADIASFATELGLISGRCVDKLAPIKPLVDEALGIASRQ